MMRKEYIAGLEEIRKRMIEIGQAFAAVDLTDATGMERDRRKKTAKLVGDLADRLYEDIAISAKVAADKAEAGQSEQDDLFAAADREKKAKAKEAKVAEAAVVEIPAIEYKPNAQNPDNDPKPDKGKGKKSSKGGKGKKPGKKGGAK